MLHVPPDPYDVLGIAPSAEDAVVTAAYRALVKKYHPDVSHQEDAAQRIRDINAAYEVLSDPDRRAALDSARANNSTSTTSGGADEAGSWAITGDASLIIPAHVLNDAIVVNLLAVPRATANQFSQDWHALQSLNDCGLYGPKVLGSTASAAVGRVHALMTTMLGSTLGLDVPIGIVAEPVFEAINRDGESVFDYLRHASTVDLGRRDERELRQKSGQTLTAMLSGVMDNLVAEVLNSGRRHGFDADVPEEIERRRQSAFSIISSRNSPTLAQAIASAQCSLYDNEAALVVLFEHLLADPRWPDRLGEFIKLVLMAGPSDFFVGKMGTPSAASACLEQAGRQLLRDMRDAASVRRKLGIIEHALPDWWAQIGLRLIVHEAGAQVAAALQASATLTDLLRLRGNISAATGLRPREVLPAAPQAARQAYYATLIASWLRLPATTPLPPEATGAANELGLGAADIAAAAVASIETALKAALDSPDPVTALDALNKVARVDALLPLSVLQTYIESSAAVWADRLRAHALAALSTASEEVLLAINRLVELLLPTQPDAFLEEVALQSLRSLAATDAAGPPSAVLNVIARCWGVDAPRLWARAVRAEVVADALQNELHNAATFNARVTRLLRSLPDAEFRQQTYTDVCVALAGGQEAAPGTAGDILRATAAACDIDDPRVTMPRPDAALSQVRALLLEGLNDVPGTMLPAQHPDVQTVIDQTRKVGRHISRAATLAVLGGANMADSHVLTAEGVYSGDGRFIPYTSIDVAEAVNGWAQDYVRLQVGNQTIELNRLGSRDAAEWVAKAIRNGIQLAVCAERDPALAWCGGHDQLGEVLMDMWAAPAPMVLRVGGKGMLPASLVRPHLLPGLVFASQPALAASTPVLRDSVSAAPLSSPPTMQGQPDATSVILELCGRQAGKDFGVGEGIDARKLANARKSFPMPLHVRVYALIDGTILGTNEKGLAITANGLYWKNSWTQDTRLTHLNWSEFDQVRIDRRGGNVTLGDGNVVDLSASACSATMVEGLLQSLQSSLRLMPPAGQLGRGNGVGSTDDAPPVDVGIAAVIVWACNLHSGGAIPVGTEINPKKLNNARQAFPIPAASQVVGLIDCTVFGSNKTGLALCDDGIVWKNDWTTKTQVNHLSWVDLANREAGAAKNEILFGSDAVFGMTGAGITPRTVVSVLNAIRDARR